MLKIHLFNRLNLAPLFFICLVIKFILSGLFGKIVSLLFPNQLEHSISKLPPYESFAAAIVFAPFFETLIFQLLLFFAGEKLRLSNSHIVIISSILFALSHHTSFAYVVVALLSGLFYNIVYLHIKEKYETVVAFFFIVGIHAIYNFVVWLNILFIK